MQTFSEHLANKILKQSGKEFRLKRPIEILIKKAVIAQLKAVYKSDSETGGILKLQVSGVSKLVCTEFIEVKNKSVSDSTYNPDLIEWNNQVQSILDAGFLPLPVHTHPTKLGLHFYDSKRVKFYLGSSKADRVIARQTEAENLNMPEAIFVQDERFGSGYGISLYEGTIFPNSITAISDLQISIAVSAGIFLYSKKLTRKLLYLLFGLFLFEFLRRPKYLKLANGDFLIDVTY